MPKKIHTFKTVEKAKAVLSNFSKHFEYPQHTDQENNFIVKKSVGGSLFRAFKGISEPSKIYRNWANKNFDTIISTFSTIKKISEYDDYIDKLRVLIDKGHVIYIPKFVTNKTLEFGLVF